ncbi:MAG: AmmeMemoRadiSam system protein B [candidate division Zixibacteria bacterium]|nr:AmmeMemoRadiSam system protein B [candidate division Zixibacteria bacterium]
MNNGRSHQEIRRAMVAGTFYPAAPAALAKQLAELFANTERRIFPGPVRAIIAPHAGYIYSGQVAANAYKQIEGEQYDSVVVIAPMHGFFKGVSVYSGDAYETPLGPIDIDRKLSAAMSGKHPAVYASTVGHAGSGGRGEHSLEVQLPFLQIVLGKFRLVAMIMGDQEESTIRAASEVLSATLKGTNTLLVASSDLSHFHPDKEARQMDKRFENALAAYDTDRMIEVVTSGGSEACGIGPIAAVVDATRRLGGQNVEIISYDTSAKATGDFSEVVGYLSAVVIGKKEIPKPAPVVGSPMKKKPEGYTEEEKLFLRDLAHQAVEAGVTGKRLTVPSAPTPRLEEKRGVFVTLTLRGSLRGCIGLVTAKKRLFEAVAEMAQAAAFDDPRFNHVTERELPDLEFEISVLSPLVKVDDVNDIVVGRDGLMIKLDLHSGLLLPQVASEFGWDRTAFLEQTCLKAGLPKHIYQNPRAEIYKFTVDRF